MTFLQIAEYIIEALKKYDQEYNSYLAYYMNDYEGDKVIANALLQLYKEGKIAIIQPGDEVH